MIKYDSLYSSFQMIRLLYRFIDVHERIIVIQVNSNEIIKKYDLDHFATEENKFDDQYSYSQRPEHVLLKYQ